MKAWVKPGLETLNVSMTMNNNVINSVIASTAEDPTNPVETPIIEDETVDEVEAVDNSSGTETDDDSSKEPIVENEPEAIKETEQGTVATKPSPEEENCAAVDTNTESETNGLFVEEASLFNETSSVISEEFQIEGGCSTFSLSAEEMEEIEKALASS